ncbi:hypothetical protein OQ640_31130, partial [Klebsiella pneumoniae]|nr:hypothetical protein [Klebsiella pneumoniae]
MNLTLNSQNSLTDNATQGCLIGRAWIPNQISGPSTIILRRNQVFDISEKFHTISEVLESSDPLKALSEIEGRQVGPIDELFANTIAEPDTNKAYFLAPIDLQVIKAAGVT